VGSDVHHDILMSSVEIQESNEPNVETENITSDGQIETEKELIGDI
jgi:hypothetical protein